MECKKSYLRKNETKITHFGPFLGQFSRKNQVCNSNSSKLDNKYVNFYQMIKIKQIVVSTIIIFSIIYLLLFIVILGILKLFNLQMTGLFQWFVIVSSIIVAAWFFGKKGKFPPETIEKTIIISSCTIIAFLITFGFSRYFNTYQPNVSDIVLGFIVTWFPFGAITENVKKS